jgi:Protein of unknown function (DUF3747)
MKPIYTSVLTSLLTVSFTSIANNPPVNGASTFEEQAIEQNQIVAVARPYGNNKYDLLVIEQIPNKKQCWDENGTKPTTIEPLLLKFDFTGHCNRSTDSNGYSIRVEGQDYGLDYLLRVVQRNGELFLVGTPRTSASKGEILVGRTYGMKPGLLKFILNPGWQFSKRAYQGKVLGHVYFSGDRTALNTTDDSTTVATLPTTNNNRAPVSDIPTTNSDRSNRSLNNPSSQSNNRKRELTFTAGNSAPASTSRPLPASLSSPQTSDRNASTTTSPPSRRLPSVFSSPLPASSATSATSRRLPSVLKGEQAASTTNSRRLPASLSRDRDTVNTLPPPPPIPSGRVPQTSSSDAGLTPPQSNNVQIVPPPSSNARSNSQKTLSDVIAVSPRPLPGASSSNGSSSDVAMSGQNYRVLIEASDRTQQDKLRSRYPDAFRTIYQGRAMWQIGVFGNRDNADQALQSVQSLGLDGMILE